jgi:hypothetical protein
MVLVDYRDFFTCCNTFGHILYMFLNFVEGIKGGREISNPKVITKTYLMQSISKIKSRHVRLLQQNICCSLVVYIQR